MRKALLNLVVGANGEGKTTFLKRNIIDRNNPHGKKNIIIVTPDPVEHTEYPLIEEDNNFAKNIYYNEGTKRIIWNDNLPVIVNNCYNCTLILDDIKTILTNSTPQFMANLYIRRRQRMVDIYFVSHFLMEIPPRAFSFANYLILFKINENINRRKNIIDENNFEKIAKAKYELDNSKKYSYKIIELLK